MGCPFSSSEAATAADLKWVQNGRQVLRIDAWKCHGHFQVFGTGPAAQIRHQGQKIACLGSCAGVIAFVLVEVVVGERPLHQTHFQAGITPKTDIPGKMVQFDVVQGPRPSPPLAGPLQFSLTKV